MKFLLLTLAYFFLYSKGIAGNSIKGQVFDIEGPVVGATVFLESTSHHSITTEEGKFILLNVNEGNYVLTISAIGYETYRTQISLSSGEIKELPLIILKENNVLSEVVVQAKRKGIYKSINMIKTSPRLINVISHDQTLKLPVKNVADLVAHMPGANIQRNKGENSIVSLRGTPSDWTSTMINGDRMPVADEENTTRSFEFEVMPAEVVQYAITTLTNSPEIESDNVGGSINFLTHRPEYKKSLELSVASGINQLAGKPTGNINLLWETKSPNNKLGMVLNGSYYGRYYAADAIKNVFGSNFNHGINRMELRRYDGFRATYGSNLGVEYKFNSRYKIGSNLFWGYMTDDKYMKKQSYNWFDDNGPRIYLQSVNAKLLRQLFGGDISVELNPNDRLKINARMAAYNHTFHFGPIPYADKKDPRNGFLVLEFMSQYLNYTDVSMVDLYGQPIDPNSPDINPIKLFGSDEPYGQGDSPYNIQASYLPMVKQSDFNFTQAYTETNQTFERDPIVAQADVEYKISDQLQVKTGFKFRDKIGYRHISKHEWFQKFGAGVTQPFNINDYNLEDFSSTPGGFLKEFGANYEGKLFSFLTQDEVRNFIINHSSKLREVYMNKYNNSYREWVGSSYDYREDQLASYLMGTYQNKKFNLNGGCRFELTSLKESSDTLTTKQVFDSVIGQVYFVPERRSISRQYPAWLPSINSTFYFGDKINLRLAASRSMHRPNFEETKPGHAVIKYNDLEITFGNPYLKPVYSTNVDLSFEYFWGNRGYFSLGTYYKKVKDHIVQVATATIDNASGIIIKQYQNVPNAWIYGVEMVIEKKLDFLSGFFSGFGLSANANFSVSRMDIPGRTKKQAMTEQTPLLYNATLFYEKNGFDTRIALAYYGVSLNSLNLTTISGLGLLHQDNDYDMYNNEYYSLDYQFSYSIKDKYTFFLEANNLLNAPERKYIGKNWRIYQTEFYRFKAQIGFRFDI